MGLIHCLCTKERQLLTVQRRLLYLERTNKLLFVNHFSAKPVYWISQYGIISQTLYTNIGYWQIYIEEPDPDKYWSTAHHGLNRFIPIVFGLQEAPGTCQRTVNVIVSTLKWDFVWVYLENIFVVLRTLENIFTASEKYSHSRALQETHLSSQNASQPLIKSTLLGTSYKPEGCKLHHTL